VASSDCNHFAQLRRSLCWFPSPSARRFGCGSQSPTVFALRPSFQRMERSRSQVSGYGFIFGYSGQPPIWRTADSIVAQALSGAPSIHSCSIVEFARPLQSNSVRHERGQGGSANEFSIRPNQYPAPPESESTKRPRCDGQGSRFIRQIVAFDGSEHDDEIRQVHLVQS
jgi:hypothetical protein